MCLEYMNEVNGSRHFIGIGRYLKGSCGGFLLLTVGLDANNRLSHDVFCCGS